MLVKDALVTLMKFQNKDKLEKLQNGEMYMKPLQYFIDLEKQSIVKFINDDLEAKTSIQVENIKIFENDNNSLFLESPSARSTLSLGYEKCPVFCMFSLDMRNCQSEKLCGNKLEYVMSFSEEQKNSFKKFGDSVLVVSDKFELFNRVEKAFKKRKIDFTRDFVEYYEEDSPSHFKNVLNNSCHIAFSKREKCFSLQQEYRFLANTKVDTELILDIGNIKDISTIYPIEDVINTEYKAILTLND